MTDMDFVTGRYIGPEDLEEHDPKHPKIKPHSPIVLLVIVGAVALMAAMSMMFIVASRVAVF